MNTQIEEIKKNPDLENFSFGIKVHFASNPSNGNWNYSGWTAEGNYGTGGNNGPGDVDVVGMCTTVGLAAGSFFPGPGWVIGAAIGFVVGTVLAALFGESPKEKWTRIYREQGALAQAAANALADEGIGPPASAACTRYVENAELAHLFTNVNGEIEQVSKEASAVKMRLDSDYSSLKKAYALQLEKLAVETLPLAQELVNDRFEDYFKDAEKRSAESKAFAKKLAPSLEQVLDKKPSSRVDSEQRLWDGLIEGDALYSGRENFSFVRAAGEESLEPEILYWEVFSNAVVKKLQGGTP